VPFEPGHVTAVGVALAPELVLDDDEDTSVDVGAADEELLAPDEVEETEGMMSLAPQIEGDFPAAPRVDLR
jgi:hypothetical protein